MISRMLGASQINRLKSIKHRNIRLSQKRAVPDLATKWKDLMRIMSGDGIPIIRLESYESEAWSPKINVVIPTLGRPRIRDTIDSLLTSTRDDIHIIVVVQENAEFAAMLRKKYATEKNIEIIFEKERMGWTWAANLIAQRRGSLFAVADDIVVMRDTIEILDAVLHKHFPDEDGIACPYLTQTYMNKRQGFPGAFTFIGDKFIDRFPNRKIFCPDYFVHGPDTELRNYAISVNKCVQAADAKILHFEKCRDEMDETGKITTKRSTEARELLWERQDRGYLWGRDFNLVRANPQEKKIKISVITRWWNEKFLAPFFLNHYQFADEILILLETGTDEDIHEIVSRYPNASIRYCTTPCGKLDDKFLADMMSSVASELASDWVIYVNSDEFVFAHDMKDIRLALKEADGNLIYTDFWQVYRHATDKDLDPKLPTIQQRRHGDPNRSEGYNSIFQKPVIVKPEVGIQWHPGEHTFIANPKIKVSTMRFDGTHWSLADPVFAIDRIIKGRKERFSEKNMANQWGYQWFNITEEEIRAECDRHLNDPQLF